ncbi:MAG: UbiH/UbiF/VisC/COQ6 family ubiquinone biosynthesis hydroxylase [Pseudomonadota bacterium]
MDNPAGPSILRPMHDPQHIVIVGGGLTGPLMALALARAGLRCTVIDAKPETVRRNAAFDGRSYAVALTSRRLLDNLELWDRLEPDAQAILQIKVSDGRAGAGASPLWLGFDHAEIEEGPMGHMVQDRFLRRALLDAIAAEPSITHLSGAEVVGQSAGPAGIEVTLADGTTLHAALLIGADGRSSGSGTRAGIRRIEKRYDQTALVAAVEHAEPHNGTAHQYFMPSGPLAILPLPGNRSSIVWSERAETARDFMALNDADFLTVLRPRFGSFLGDIKLAGKRWSYPLGLTLAQRMVADRVALIGDAAHGVHPIAGQGLNAGMRDIAALADIIGGAAARGEDVGGPGALARFQDWRGFDNTALALATDSFNRLFSNDNPLLRGIRTAGLGLVSAAPRLRRSFIREAAGLTGTLPELMR